MRRWLLGAASVVPFLACLWTLPLRARLNESAGKRIPIPYDLLLPFAGLLLLSIAAVVAFIVHARSNPQLDDRTKLTWSLALVFVNLVSLPAYWWRYVRQQ